MYHVTSYGADPSGKNDSTTEILHAISDAARDPGNGILYKNIINLGGVRIDLDGGNYKISRPLRLPVAGRGNLMVYTTSHSYNQILISIENTRGMKFVMYRMMIRQWTTVTILFGTLFDIIFRTSNIVIYKQIFNLPFVT